MRDCVIHPYTRDCDCVNLPACRAPFSDQLDAMVKLTVCMCALEAAQQSSRRPPSTTAISFAAVPAPALAYKSKRNHLHTLHPDSILADNSMFNIKINSAKENHDNSTIDYTL